MKKMLILSVSLGAMLLIGIGIGYYSRSHAPQPAATTETKKPLYYIDPMEPTIRYDKPGKSRMGMDVVPVYAEDGASTNEPPTVRIAPAVINNLGIRTAPVEKGRLAQTLQTVGYIEANEKNISHIHTYAEGWIKKLYTKITGEAVKQGQVLFQLYSPALLTAQEEYLIALEHHNTLLIQAAAKKLRVLGMAERQIQGLKQSRKIYSLVDVEAPQNGFITALNVREGMRVTPETEVMSLSDLATVWAMANIPEKQAAYLSLGQSAEAHLAAFPGKVWSGKVEYIYPQVEATTRTVKARLRFANPESLLKPNMYADITLFTKPKENVVSIPIEAVIPAEKGNRVIVALGEGRFQVRAVKVGMQLGARVEIISGLKPGESVVTSAQFLIDSEASLKSSLERMEPPTPEQPAAIEGQGIIKAIHPDTHQLTLQHEPIAALNWPEMTMDFQVADTVDLTKLQVGSTVHFTLTQDKNEQYIITQLK